MRIVYRALNPFFHLAHLSIIGFLSLGWISPRTQGAHLAFVGLVLAIWAWLGYCPLTRWHWQIRDAAGLPRASGPYIPFLLSKIRGRQVDVKKTDRNVVAATLAFALLSLGFNLYRWLHA